MIWFNSPKYTCHLIYLSVLLIISIHFIMELGLSYVNKNGCYRNYTDQSGTINNEHKNLYDNIMKLCQNVQ